MIAQLTGTVARVHPEKRYIVLVVGDIGYKVFVPTTVFEQVMVGHSTTVHTYHHLREDASDLYGFRELVDVDMFERLIGVAGIGPKVALTVLSQLSSSALRSAIVGSDLALLTQVPGIGKKIAERLVLELKQTLLETDMSIATTPDQSQAQDVIAALQNFGYSSAEIRSVLMQVDRTATVSAQIKAALGYLSQPHGRAR